MGRRKKEPPSVHRSQIAQAASALFLEKGTAAVSMDDIAKAAGYSKATLYVYFENKDEIVSALTLDSMKKLAGDRNHAAEIRFDLPTAGPVSAGLPLLFSDFSANH